MANYWANAIGLDPKGKPERLLTYAPCHNVNDCEKIISDWVKNCSYRLLISWVEVVVAEKEPVIMHKKEYRNNYYC